MKFKVSGEIIVEFSEKISFNLIALNELIKNAYDAGANNVSIYLDNANNTLKISDDGSDMSENNIQELLHISKSSKNMENLIIKQIDLYKVQKEDIVSDSNQSPETSSPIEISPSKDYLIPQITNSDYVLNLGKTNIAKLCAQINNLSTSKKDYRELIACSFRSIFEISMLELKTQNRIRFIQYPQGDKLLCKVVQFMDFLW
jgi:hypothetical protein